MTNKKTLKKIEKLVLEPSSKSEDENVWDFKVYIYICIYIYIYIYLSLNAAVINCHILVA